MSRNMYFYQTKHSYSVSYDIESLILFCIFCHYTVSSGEEGEEDVADNEEETVELIVTDLNALVRDICLKYLLCSVIIYMHQMAY